MFPMADPSKCSLFRPMILVLILVLFSGCLTTFEHPLTRPDDQALDQTLFGTWIGGDDDETVFLHIGKDADGDKLLVVMTDIDADGKIDISTLGGHTSILKSGRYMNLKWLLPRKNQTRGYILIKYALENNSLHLYATDDTVIETDIRKGRLKGEIQKTKEAYVTEPMKGLLQYVVKKDALIFPRNHLLGNGLKPLKK